MKPPSRILTGAFAAALYALSFAPVGTGFLGFVFLVPVFHHLARRQFHGGFGLLYPTGVMAIGALLHWLAANQGATPGQAVSMYVLTVLYLSFAWGLFGWSLCAVCKKYAEKGLWSAPLLWSAMEFIQSRGEFGFVWHSVSTSQSYYLPLVQFASYTGVFGVSSWVVLLNVLFYFWIQQLMRVPSAPRGAAGRLIPFLVAGVLALPALHGLIVMRPEVPSAGDAPIRVAAVQPNVDSKTKWHERGSGYLRLMDLTASLSAPPYDLVVWPETALPFQVDAGRLGQIRSLVSGLHLSLMTGVHAKSREDSAPEKNVNRVDLYTFRGGPPRSYEKIHLVPFGEYVPASMTALEKMMLQVGAGKYVPGQDATVFQVPRSDGNGTFCVGALVCLESTFPQLARDLVKNGARLLVVVANDQWYDHTPQIAQHGRLAALRAVELGVPVVRAGNSGITAAYDSHGREIGRVDPYEAATLTASIYLSQNTTFYGRHGDWFGLLCVFLSVLVIGSSFFRKRNHRPIP